MLDLIKNLVSGFHFNPWTTICVTLIFPALWVLKKTLPKYIKEWITFLIDGFLYSNSKSIKLSLASAISMKRYCKMQLGNESIKYMHSLYNNELIIDIDSKFIKRLLRYNQDESNIDSTNYLELGNRIKIIGEPNCGKSALVKKTFRNLCKSSKQQSRKTKLPILIDLGAINIPGKKIGLNPAQWLYDYIRSEVAKVHVYKMDECFDAYVSSKGVIIFLDGLDKVPSNNYNFIEKAVNGLSRKLAELSEQNTIVLTMCSEFHQQTQADFASNFPHATFLGPF